MDYGGFMQINQNLQINQLPKCPSIYLGYKTKLKFTKTKQKKNAIKIILNLLPDRLMHTLSR